MAKNARYDDVTGAFPAVVYMPVAEDVGIPVEAMTFFLRTAGDPLGYASVVREIVHQADWRLPVTNLGTQTAQIDREMSQQILFARLCTGFAMLALAIACVGLYGTMSYTVVRRTSEIGIRMALGAQRGTVVWMVMRETIVLVLVGIAIGVPIALGATRLVSSQLFGLSAADPLTLLAAASVLGGVGVLAGFLPARKASKVNPLVALRYE